MGAYSPLPWADPFLADDVVERVVRPTVDELARRGTPFVGIVYAGLALTPKGMRVVEFNARFGDPETQVVLARLLTPLAHLLRAAATGRLDQVEPLRWSPDAAVTVVVAAAGYPGAPVTGDPVSGIAQADAEPGCYVLHAGTRDADGTVVSAGGRVLSIVGTGPDLATARDHAYRAAAHITLPGRQMRTDIAAAAVADEIVVP
jgi:phosphoribosylamine--glycine ligase